MTRARADTRFRSVAARFQSRPDGNTLVAKECARDCHDVDWGSDAPGSQHSADPRSRTKGHSEQRRSAASAAERHYGTCVFCRDSRLCPGYSRPRPLRCHRSWHGHLRSRPVCAAGVGDPGGADLHRDRARRGLRRDGAGHRARRLRIAAPAGSCRSTHWHTGWLLSSRPVRLAATMSAALDTLGR
jgi:hypothetical protein